MSSQQPIRYSRVTTPGSTYVYFVFACLSVLAVLAMPIYRYFSVGSGAVYSCITGYVPPDAVPNEVSPRAWATSFPAGRYCEWESITGGVTTYQTGWVTTIAACVATLVVVGMTILAIREHRPQRTLVTLVPILLTFAAWLAVFLR